jgi:hypothetical protein
MRIKLLSLLLVLVLIVAACSTVPFAGREENIMKTVNLINLGDTAKLADLTQQPFLFDAEIVMMERDIEMMWRNISEAGFRIINPKLVEAMEVDSESYAQFGNSFEVETYFKKYLPEETTLARIVAENGEFLFLLHGKQEEYPQIYGFKVM